MERQNSGLEESRRYDNFFPRHTPAAETRRGRGRPRIAQAAITPRAFAGVPLDEALRRYVAALSGATGARLEALLKRIGWGERPACTLLHAGESIGVTRERMRQLEADLRKKAARNPIFVEALERALSLLERERRSEPAVTARELADRGITTAAFLPENVLAAARLFGRVEAPEAVSIARAREASLKRARGLLRLAARIAHGGGVANVGRVVAEAAKLDPTLTAPFVRSVLAASPEIRFLDESWFFVDEPQRAGGNRLMRALRAMLSITPVLDLPRIHAGVERAYQYSSVECPPAAIVTELLRAHPAFTLRGGEVVSKEALDPDVELTPLEKVFVQVFRAAPGGLMRTTALMRACAARGMSRYLFWMTASSSPILDRFARAAWSLRGAPVTREATDALERDARRGKAFVAFGRSHGGRPWIETPVRGPRLRRFPRELEAALGGAAFVVSARQGADTRLGSIRMSPCGSPSGIQPILRRLGSPERGNLRLVFDLERRTAIASVIREVTPRED